MTFIKFNYFTLWLSIEDSVKTKATSQNNKSKKPKSQIRSTCKTSQVFSELLKPKFSLYSLVRSAPCIITAMNPKGKGLVRFIKKNPESSMCSLGI